ncbi:MAG: response regulator [Proteobacteria bacterium]|nr:response regulator [Pseudomonadota bacterium]
MEKSEVPRKRILLVDHAELFLQLQISYLGTRRFDIDTARSGEEALEKTRRWKPDLILLDLFMPEITGDAVCRILKSHEETSFIPIYLISSGRNSEFRKRVETSGCDGLIYKPVRKDMLLSVVERHLGNNTRTFPRIKVQFPAKVVLDEKEWDATIHSLSCQGAFIEQDRGKVLVGDLLNVRLFLPDAEKGIDAPTTAVVWQGTLGSDGPWGTGVQFLGLYPDEARKIENYVTEHIISHGHEGPGIQGGLPERTAPL